MIAGKSLEKTFEEIEDYWSPKIIGTINDQYVKLAKLKGEFIWHDHADEDEFFYVVRGSLVIEFDDKTVELQQGEFYIVPKSVRHKPVANEECWIMLIEPKSTKHTGNIKTEFTKSIEEQF